MKAFLKKNLGLIYIAITVIIIVVLGISNQSFSDLFASFASFDYFWLVLMLACVAAYYLLENYSLWYYLKSENEPMGFFSALKATMIGQYYCALTPFASGGQPMQIYYMHKKGVSMGVATSAMTVKVVIFNVTMVATAIIGVIYNIRYFLYENNFAFVFAIVGILANSVVIVLFWMMFFNQSFGNKVVRGVVRLLGKIRIIKDMEKANAKLDDFLGEYFLAIGFIKKNPKRMVWLSIITLVQTFAFMSVSYCIYRAFGYNEQSPILFITLQYVLFIAVSYVPLPGASGAQEIGFMQIFGKFLPEDKVFTVMMIWRFFTYIAVIIVGGCVIVWDEIRGIAHRRREE